MIIYFIVFYSFSKYLNFFDMCGQCGQQIILFNLKCQMYFNGNLNTNSLDIYIWCSMEPILYLDTMYMYLNLWIFWFLWWSHKFLCRGRFKSGLSQIFNIYKIRFTFNKISCPCCACSNYHWCYQNFEISDMLQDFN